MAGKLNLTALSLDACNAVQQCIANLLIKSLLVNGFLPVSEALKRSKVLLFSSDKAIQNSGAGCGGLAQIYNYPFFSYITHRRKCTNDEVNSHPTPNKMIFGSCIFKTN